MKKLLLLLIIPLLSFGQITINTIDNKKDDVKSGPSPLPEKSLSSEDKKGDTSN